ncbi:MAG: hypothetical protein MUC72_03955, partial [Acidobacteria bacterium]|nr:hypothetical protein [Acidobacteriota bacterium]
MKLLKRLLGQKNVRGTKATLSDAQVNPPSSWVFPEIQKNTPPTDETLQPGERLSIVSSEGDLTAGVVIRVWHDYLRKWIPGWWSEVISVAGGKVYLRDLMSGEESTRAMGDTLGSAWKHPFPERLKGLGEQKATARSNRLSQLSVEYEMLDFSQATLGEMESALKTELKWKIANMNDFYNMKDEFEIREIALARIGYELNRRGGLALMQQV